MDGWNTDSTNTIATFVAVTTLCISLYEKFGKKPKLALEIESSKLIEDYPGEIGIQINFILKAYNESLSLREFEISHSNIEINRISEVNIEIRKYTRKDIITEYLDSLKNDKSYTANKRDNDKLDQFTYYTDLESGKAALRIDRDTGNPIDPNVNSCFQNSLKNLCEMYVGLGEYKEISEKIESVRDLQIDKNTSCSFTLFIHIYGHIDRSINRRKVLPLDGWRIIVNHSEGKVKKKLVTDKLSYSQLKEFLNSV
jgi:hypothetical protein